MRKVFDREKGRAVGEDSRRTECSRCGKIGGQNLEQRQAVKIETVGKISEELMQTKTKVFYFSEGTRGKPGAVDAGGNRLEHPCKMKTRGGRKNNGGAENTGL